MDFPHAARISTTSSRSPPSAATTGVSWASVTDSTCSRRFRPSSLKASPSSRPRLRSRSSALSSCSGLQARVRMYDRSGSPQNSSVSSPVSIGSRPADTQAMVWESPRYSRSWSPSLPDPSDRVVGEPEGADARVQRSPLDREVFDGPGEQLVGPGQAGRVVAQDAAELTDRARVAGGADGRRVGERPPVGHGGHHDRRVEDGERRRHQLARHLAHDRPAAGEVGRAVGEGHLAGLAGARAEAQRDIGGMALGREVHLPDHGLQGRSEAAGRGDGATVGYRHGRDPRRAAPC